MDLLIYMSSVRRKYFHIQDKTTGCRNKDTLISLCRVRWPSCPTTAAEEVSLRSSFASKVARMSPGRKAQDRSGAPLDEGREKLVSRELEHQPLGWLVQLRKGKVEELLEQAVLGMENSMTTHTTERMPEDKILDT